MFEFINYTADKVILFLLVIIRISGLFITAPIYSDRAIPTLIKVGFAVLLGLVLLPTVPLNTDFSHIQSNWQLAGLVVNEILIGFMIGLVFRLIFFGVMTAGTIIGYQMGFMFAQVFDATNQTQVSIVGRFWYVIAILFFLTINGHHLIINSVAESFQVIPLGNINTVGTAGDMIIKYSAYIFIIAIKIASPIMITLFLTDIALGTIAKVMPTMNVFFVGMPIKIGTGLLIMVMAMPLFVYVVERSMHFFNTEMHNLLYAIGKV